MYNPNLPLDNQNPNNNIIDDDNILDLITLGEEAGLTFTGEIDEEYNQPIFVGNKNQFKKYYNLLK